MEGKTLLILGGSAVGAYLLYSNWDSITGSVTPVGATVAPVTQTSIAPPAVIGATVNNTPVQSGTATVATIIEASTPPPTTTSAAVVNNPVSTTPNVSNLINGRWKPSDWSKYLNIFDPLSLSVSQVMGGTGMSANDANDFIGDLIGNTSGASSRLSYNFGKIVFGKALAANPTKTALMLQGSFTNNNDNGLGDLTSVMGWFTESSFVAGIPNWALLVGGLGLAKVTRII